ncbi:hypothetical protein M513_09783 [Trichuris suis]|uniref:Tyrosine-protein kinase n=1 Tax=Trichuris suis TaxID=68888 RepID=A0A085LWJ0_9BILA|nr:hypothetical protein M513_09783 [Trichuris suis]
MEEPFKWKRKRAFGNDPIRKKKFFCGALPRADAEHLLEKNGQFLVRVSEPTVESASPFIISLRSQNGLFHVVILQTHKKKYHLGGPHFRTVNELVNHYVTKGLSVSKDLPLFITEGIKRVSWILHDEDIEPIEKMGEGHFGEVWKVELVTTSRRKNMTRAAVKVLKSEINNEMEKTEFFDECRKMRSLLHPNVVLFYGIVLDVEPLKLVMELCDTSLVAYVRDNKGKVKTEKKLRFCRHIACGMEYIASKQLIHRDLALRNCLLKEGVAKVADFGQAKQGRVYKMRKDTEEALPVMWIPPDTLETRTFSEKSDVWAYGITIWELFTDGRHPYDELYPKLSHDNFAEELMHIVARGWCRQATGWNHRKQCPHRYKRLCISVGRRNQKTDLRSHKYVLAWKQRVAQREKIGIAQCNNTIPAGSSRLINKLGWKQELQQYAQNLANQCSPKRLPNPQHGVAYYHSNRTAVDAIMFTRSLYQAFGMRYNYSAGKCINDDQDCISGIQMVWQQGGYMGCGRARCNKMDLAVCAYTHKYSDYADRQFYV